MKIFVEARPKSKEEKIEKINEKHFKVWVREPPQDSKANMAIMKVMVKYFNIKWTDISLVSGFSSRTKIFEINK